MKPKKQCGAHARTTGAPCKAQGLPNGRCKLHGGMSTGPKTPEGRQAISSATKARMSDFQLQMAKDGFQKWLATGGRDELSKRQKGRHTRSKKFKAMT